jgi:hypothetical protein
VEAKQVKSYTHIQCLSIVFQKILRTRGASVKFPFLTEFPRLLPQDNDVGEDSNSAVVAVM